MYSLVVCQAVAARRDSSFAIDRSRFLEYTANAISRQLQTLSTEAIGCIQSWPCIVMQEGRGQEEAQVVEITALEGKRTEVSVTVRPLPDPIVLTNDSLWRLRDALDIAEFEFSRNHWAIKDRDVFSVLAGKGFPPARAASHFTPKALPSPPRAELIRAGKVISEWSHTDIDDFLLEAGVSDLAAGRELGNRRNRANAIVRFSLEYPGAITAENLLFAAYVVRRVRSTGPVLDRSEDSAGESEAETESETGAPSRSAVASAASRSPNRVFVVHGQNEVARGRVVTFLESLGLKGIVLHEQPNMGRHLLTKFMNEAELVTFAVVLMTDDDVGSLKGATQLRPRARQNVVLELGYFLAHLRQPRVCALITPGLETPSDFDGIVYIRMDDKDTWKAELRRELVAAGLPVGA